MGQSWLVGTIGAIILVGVLRNPFYEGKTNVGIFRKWVPGDPLTKMMAPMVPTSQGGPKGPSQGKTPKNDGKAESLEKLSFTNKNPIESTLAGVLKDSLGGQVPGSPGTGAVVPGSLIPGPPGTRGRYLVPGSLMPGTRIPGTWCQDPWYQDPWYLAPGSLVPGTRDHGPLTPGFPSFGSGRL